MTNMMNHQIFSDTKEKTFYIVFIGNNNGRKSIKACRGAATSYMRKILTAKIKSWSNNDLPDSVEFSDNYRYAFAYEVNK